MDKTNLNKLLAKKCSRKISYNNLKRQIHNFTKNNNSNTVLKIKKQFKKNISF